jgi:maleate cis-trans isomerase
MRKRIGVMIPSTNATCEADFNLVSNGAFSVHGQRLWLTDAGGDGGFERMNRDVEAGAKYLGTARVHVVAYGCVAGSMVNGPEGDRRMLAAIERDAGAPAIAVMPASLEALRSFGAKRISVATPYSEGKNAELKAYLERQGFEVVSMAGDPRAAAKGNQGVNDVPPEAVEAFAATACAPQADALFCACTAWRSLEVNEALEQKIGKPVVTANGAMIWAALRAMGGAQPVKGFGKLLETVS